MQNGILKDAFFDLLRSGLWEHPVKLLECGNVDFIALYELADEQSVVGLIAAGLEHVVDRKVTKPEAVSFLKKVFSLESRNASMNAFIEKKVLEMRQHGIYALLVKGQGIAQCYERPQWRSSGDIDFFFDEENYAKAKSFFSKEVEITEPEGVYNKHLGMTIDSWTVELHGTHRSGLSARVDRGIDHIQADTFMNRHVRVWKCGDADVFLPTPDNDIVFVFTHILGHYYKGGIGLRQICDWCRLLWTYQSRIDRQLLEKRLEQMRLVAEWKAFAYFAVDTLGIPAKSMPLYDSNHRWLRKASRIQSFIIKVGNFGQNRDLSYYQKYPYFLKKAISFAQRCGDFARHFLLFPVNSLRFFPSMVFHGISSVVRGE